MHPKLFRRTQLWIPPENLRWRCRPEDLAFRTTEELKPYTRVLGQEKALRALELGLEMKSSGYNIFICGLPGTGRRTTLRHLLERKARRSPIPLRDLVYLPRFESPERPRLVLLSPGTAPALKRDVRRFLLAALRIRERVAENRRAERLRGMVKERLPLLLERHRHHPPLIQYLRLLGGEIISRSGEINEEDCGVQILVTRRPGQPPPVLWPGQITFSAIFGAFEKHRTDERRPGGIAPGSIRTGALAEASGGFLVLPAREFLNLSHGWNTLKSCLNSRRLDIFDGEGNSLAAALGSRSETFPLDLKVILLGDFDDYDACLENDAEFARLFKIRVDFDVEVPLTRAVLTRSYPRVITRICRDEGLRHLTAPAVAKVIEYGVRRAGRKSKITIQFSAIADLIREADFWARRRRSRTISRADIEHALRETVGRLNLMETKISEMISEGTILIDTTGSRIGQVNGLAVYDQGDYQFGKPSRITAETSMGHGGIINIERESGLSGRSHDKGVQILAGYLRSRFAQRRPLSLTASVCFEQSYSGVDGDSASATEIFAILSSLSGLPIRQDIAVTGSLNQKGDIQPIGGVNEKIEGFFDCVRAGKPSGREGVIVPRRNIPDLMLRDDVVRAVRERRFFIYAIDTVEEGVEILTGRPAGKRREDGSYPEGSVFQLADRRLEEIATGLKNFPGAREWH